MANVYREVEDMIKFMGGTHQVLINWHWCNNLASEELANGFVKWLEERGFEHRGIFFRDDLYHVRYRHLETMKKEDDAFNKTIREIIGCKDTAFGNEEELTVEYRNIAKKIPYSGFYLIFQKRTDDILGGINFFPHPDIPGKIAVVFYASDLQEVYDGGFTTSESELEKEFGTNDLMQAVGLWDKWNSYEI